MSFPISRTGVDRRVTDFEALRSRAREGVAFPQSNTLWATRESRTESYAPILLDCWSQHPSSDEGHMLLLRDNRSVVGEHDPPREAHKRITAPVFGVRSRTGCGSVEEACALAGEGTGTPRPAPARRGSSPVRL